MKLFFKAQYNGPNDTITAKSISYIQKSNLDNTETKCPQEVQVQDILEQKFQMSHSYSAYNHAISQINESILVQ